MRISDWSSDVCSSDLHPHSDAEAIYQAVRPSLPTISVQAIHLIVQDLSRQGLIRRISLPDSASARYETRIEDNHHHIQCVQCGRIEDIDCVVGHAPCIEPSEDRKSTRLNSSH